MCLEMRKVSQVAPYVYISVHTALVIGISIFGAVFETKAVDTSKSDGSEEDTCLITCSLENEKWLQ